jgi:hypothetical protein
MLHERDFIVLQSQSAVVQLLGERLSTVAIVGSGIDLAATVPIVKCDTVLS